jgi:hypothetical protein
MVACAYVIGPVATAWDRMAVVYRVSFSANQRAPVPLEQRIKSRDRAYDENYRIVHRRYKSIPQPQLVWELYAANQIGAM